MARWVNIASPIGIESLLWSTDTSPLGLVGGASLSRDADQE
jgi:hypothetical protein